VWNIIEGSHCGIELHLDDGQIPPVVRDIAAKVDVDPWNMMFCWGDWQVICTVAHGKVDRLRTEIATLGVTARKLGIAVEGPPELYGLRDTRRGRIEVVRNENFTASSFNRGTEAQLWYMLRAPLLRD
jgi:thiamine monophosphate kinase